MKHTNTITSTINIALQTMRGRLLYNINDHEDEDDNKKIDMTRKYLHELTICAKIIWKWVHKGDR